MRSKFQSGLPFTFELGTCSENGVWLGVGSLTGWLVWWDVCGSWMVVKKIVVELLLTVCSSSSYDGSLACHWLDDWCLVVSGEEDYGCIVINRVWLPGGLVWIAYLSFDWLFIWMVGGRRLVGGWF